MSYTITGYVNSDTQSVVSGTATLTTTATANSNVGTYPITFATEGLTAANYSFTYVPGAVTITGGDAQTITFGPLANLTYGASPITQSATASSGLQVSFTVTGPGVVSGNTLTITGAGTIAVTAIQSGNADYSAATPVTQSFTVAKAGLTVTADNESMAQGNTPGTLTYTISGFVNGDTQAIVTGTPSLTTTATASSPIGTYPITIALETLSATNYSFTFVNGTLSVIAGTAQTITFSAIPSLTYGAAPYALVAHSSSGLTVTFSVAQGPASIVGSNLLITGAGAVTVTASLPGQGIYSAAARLHKVLQSSRLC